jgi:hypothetical protein
MSKLKARRIGYFRSGQSQPFGALSACSGQAFGALSACSGQAGRGSLRRGKAGFFGRVNHGIDSSPLADRSHCESTRLSSPDSNVSVGARGVRLLLQRVVFGVDQPQWRMNTGKFRTGSTTMPRQSTGDVPSNTKV